MWMAPYRPDVLFVVKELARVARRPLASHWLLLKHVVRYLRGTRKHSMHLQVDRQGDPDILVCMVDASWASGAGCRSTTGVLLQIMGFTLLCFSRTQPNVSLSSCEAELYAICAGAAEGMLVRQLAKELGVELCLQVASDSASGLAVCRKRGVGRMKHLSIRQLWIQDALRNNEVVLRKITTEENVADSLTKPLARGRFQEMAVKIGVYDETTNNL